MVSSVTSSAAFSAASLSGSQCRGSGDTQALQEKLFSKLDADGNGSIDQSELSQFLDFAASSSGATSAATDSNAADLFKTLDSDGDGTLSKTELSDGAKKLFDELRTQLMTKSAASADSSAASATQDKPDASQLFARMDTNGDGSVDQSELSTFLQSKPQGTPPHHQGAGLFSKIDSLLDQYRSTSSDTSNTETSTLSVAA